MDKILAQLPKSLIAFLAISVGIAFFILSDPPRSLCDVQKRQFAELQAGFLFDDETSKPKRKADFANQLERCKADNGPGGCYSLFMSMRQVVRDLQTIASECYSEIGDVKSFRVAMWESLTLMTKAAWGSQPPANYHQKMGWLDAADMSLFCELKSTVIAIYGAERWKSFIQKQMVGLPGAKNLQRQEAWERMILSVNCSQF